MVTLSSEKGFNKICGKLSSFSVQKSDGFKKKKKRGRKLAATASTHFVQGGPSCLQLHVCASSLPLESGARCSTKRGKTPLCECTINLANLTIF